MNQEFGGMKRVAYFKVIEWIRDEYNRCAPEPFWAYMGAPGEIKLMDKDTPYNAVHYLQLESSRAFGFIEVWENNNMTDICSPVKPIFVCKSTAVDELMAKIVGLMGVKLVKPFRKFDLGKEVECLVKANNKFVEKGGANMDLWNEIRLVEGGQIEVSTSKLAKKYGVSSSTITSYRRYWAVCRGCGKIVIFSSSQYKRVVSTYKSELIFRQKYLCRSCGASFESSSNVEIFI